MSRLVGRVAGAFGLLLAAVVLGAPAASAAGCTDAQVTVVVDFDSLPGGVQTRCVSTSGRITAADATRSAGFEVQDVSSQPGFVCTIDGQPADQQCAQTPPANRYWGFFWSNGSGTWSYSSYGASSLKVGPGDSVGWRFQDSSTKSAPRGEAHERSATPSPSSTPKPSPKPAPAPKPAPSSRPSSAGSAPAATGPSARPTEPSSPSASASPKRRPSPGTAFSAPVPKATTWVDPSDEPTEAPSEEDGADTAQGSLGTVTGGDDPGDASSSTGVVAVAGLGGLSLLAGSAAVVAWRRRP